MKSLRANKGAFTQSLNLLETSAKFPLNLIYYLNMTPFSKHTTLVPNIQKDGM